MVGALRLNKLQKPVSKLIETHCSDFVVTGSNVQFHKSIFRCICDKDISMSGLRYRSSSLIEGNGACHSLSK